MQNKYIPNPSVDNILKGKKANIISIESQKKKINKNKSSNKIYNKFNSKINNSKFNNIFTLFDYPLSIQNIYLKLLFTLNYLYFL